MSDHVKPAQTRGARSSIRNLKQEDRDRHDRDEEQEGRVLRDRDDVQEDRVDCEVEE